MFPAEFQYFRASSVADAQRLLAQIDGAKLLAGGHSLLPLLKLRLATPPALIDIGRIAELKGITIRGNTIRIGALTTHTEVASSKALAGACPILPETAGQIGDPLVRNYGTVGGNIAHADPASDLPPVFLALGARMVAAGPKGERTIEARDFFTGMMTTDLADDEILIAIEVPVRQAGQGMAYVKFAHPASRYAVVGAAVVVTMSGGTCKAASVALGGLVPKPKRAASVEAALTGQPATAVVIQQAAAKVAGDLGGEVLGDIFASAEYRRAMAPVYVKRTLAAAVARAGQS